MSATPPHIQSPANGGAGPSAARGAGTPRTGGNARGQYGGAHSSYLEDHVARLQAEIERTTRRLEMEKRKLHELGEYSRKAQHEFHEKRLRYSYNKANARAEAQKAEYNLTLLENRLSQALGKLNSANDEINKVKATIDKHRKDRLSMEKVYRQVAKELTHQTEQLNEVKEKVAQMQEWEYQTTKKMEELNKAKEQEREDFKEQCLLMQKELREQDRLIKEFDIRSHRESSTHRAQAKGSPYSVAEEEQNFNAESLMKLILRTALLNAVQRHSIKQHRTKIAVFERAMESIKTSTGISDPEEIVAIFSQLEERNYSIMTYVNTLNFELEATESKKRQLEEHIRQQAQHEAIAQRLTDATLSDVTAQISKMLYATAGKNALIQRQLNCLSEAHEILSNTASLLTRVWNGLAGCEEPPPVSGTYSGHLPSSPNSSRPTMLRPGAANTTGAPTADAAICADDEDAKNILPLLWYVEKFVLANKANILTARTSATLDAAEHLEKKGSGFSGHGRGLLRGPTPPIAAACFRPMSSGGGTGAGGNGLGNGLFAGGLVPRRTVCTPTHSGTPPTCPPGTCNGGPCCFGAATRHPGPGAVANSVTGGSKALPPRESEVSTKQTKGGNEYQVSYQATFLRNKPTVAGRVNGLPTASSGSSDRGGIGGAGPPGPGLSRTPSSADISQSAPHGEGQSYNRMGGLVNSGGKESEGEEDWDTETERGSAAIASLGDRPLSVGELRERTIIALNRQRKKRGDGAGTLYLPEKMCLLATPTFDENGGTRRGSSVKSPGAFSLFSSSQSPPLSAGGDSTHSGLVSFMDIGSSRNGGGDSNDGENSEAGSCSSAAPTPSAKPSPPRLSSTSAIGQQRGALLLYPGSSRTREKQFVQLSATRKRVTEADAAAPHLDLQPSTPVMQPPRKTTVEKGLNDGERKTPPEITEGVRKSTSSRQYGAGGGGRAEQTTGPRASLQSQQSITRRSTRPGGKIRRSQKEGRDGPADRGGSVVAPVRKGCEGQSRGTPTNSAASQGEEEQSKEHKETTKHGEENIGERSKAGDGIEQHEPEEPAASQERRERLGGDAEGDTPNEKPPCGEGMVGQPDAADTERENQTAENETQLEGSLDTRGASSDDHPAERGEVAQMTAQAPADGGPQSAPGISEDAEDGEQRRTVDTAVELPCSNRDDNDDCSKIHESPRCRSLGLARQGSAEKLASLYGRIACYEEREDERVPRPPECDREEKMDDSNEEREDDARDAGEECLGQTYGEDVSSELAKNAEIRKEADAGSGARASLNLSTTPGSGDAALGATETQLEGSEKRGDDLSDSSGLGGGTVGEAISSHTDDAVLMELPSCTTGGGHDEANEAVVLPRSPSDSSVAKKDETENNSPPSEAPAELVKHEASVNPSRAPSSPELQQPNALPSEPSNSRRSLSPEAWHPGLLPIEALDCQNRPTSAGASSHSSRLSGNGGDRAARLQHIADNLAFCQNMQERTAGSCLAPGLQTAGQLGGEDFDGEGEGEVLGDQNNEAEGTGCKMNAKGGDQKAQLLSEDPGQIGPTCPYDAEGNNPELREGGSQTGTPKEIRSNVTVPRRHFSAGGMRPPPPFRPPNFAERIGRPLSGPVSRLPVPGELAGSRINEGAKPASVSPPFACLPRPASSPSPSPPPRFFLLPSYPPSPATGKADKRDASCTSPCDRNANTVNILRAPESNSSTNNQQGEASSAGNSLPCTPYLARSELPLLSPWNPRPLAEQLRQGPPPTSPGGIPAPTTVEQRQWLEWQQEQATRQFLLQSGCSIVPNDDVGGSGCRRPPELSSSWRADQARRGGLGNEGEAGVVLPGNEEEKKSDTTVEEGEEGRKESDGNGAPSTDPIRPTPPQKSRPVSAASNRNSVSFVLDGQGGGEQNSCLSQPQQPVSQGSEKESCEDEGCARQSSRTPSPENESIAKEKHEDETYQEHEQKPVEDCCEESRVSVPSPGSSGEEPDKERISPWKQAVEEVDSLSSRENLVFIHFPEAQRTETESAAEDDRTAGVPAGLDCRVDFLPTEERQRKPDTPVPLPQENGAYGTVFFPPEERQPAILSKEVTENTERQTDNAEIDDFSHLGNDMSLSQFEPPPTTSPEGSQPQPSEAAGDLLPDGEDGSRPESQTRSKAKEEKKESVMIEGGHQ